MKRLMFVLAVEKLAIVGLLTVALDVRLHHKFEMLGGLNIKGYRGHVMAAKKPDELRIAVVGGSFAFGWGVAANETFSGYLGRLVTESMRNRTRPPTHATDVNLAGQGITVDEQIERIRRFAYLKPDIIVLMPAFQPAELGSADGMPERSGVYALTGYMPILPLVLKEKGLLLRTGGKGRVASSIGNVLSATGQWLDAADFELKAWLPGPRTPGNVQGDYERVARESARDAIVVTPPVHGPADPRPLPLGPHTRVVDLTASELGDSALWLNDINLGAGGNSRAAGLVVPAVLETITN